MKGTTLLGKSNCCLLIWPNLIFAGSNCRFGEIPDDPAPDPRPPTPASRDCDLTIVGIFLVALQYAQCHRGCIPPRASTYLPLCETCAMMRSPCLASCA